MARRLRRWLDEPLVHFAVIGVALFGADRLVNPRQDAGTQSTRIELTDDDLRQISVAWRAQGRPAPTPEQMRALVDSRVREEVLYREALALGLDRNDTIVKRRLAQKMEFLAEDVTAIREPEARELRRWFETDPGRFAAPPRASFRHLYFSPDRRGPGAREEAAKALAKLDGKTRDWPGVAALADRFMFQDHYSDRAFDQLATLFGPTFARAVIQLEPGAWRGPIESGYGWHLVWVDASTPARVPAFEEIEPDVKSAWAAEQRAAAKQKAFEAMRDRYEVVLPGGGERVAAATPAPAAGPGR